MSIPFNYINVGCVGTHFLASFPPNEGSYIGTRCWVFKLILSVIIYGEDEISAFDSMTLFYFDGVSVRSVIEAGWYSLVEYSCIATCVIVALA